MFSNFIKEQTFYVFKMLKSDADYNSNGTLRNKNYHRIFIIFRMRIIVNFHRVKTFFYIL